MSHRDHQPVPKILGADVELANFLLGTDNVARTGSVASRLLLREIDGTPAHATWTSLVTSYTPHTSHHAQQGWWCSGNHVLAGQYVGATTIAGDPQDYGRRFLASNGGGAYIDLDHLELCIPEVRSAHDFVAAWHAMLRIAAEAQYAANRRLHAPLRLQVLVNSSDGLGNSYGSHLNVLLSRRTWENLLHRKPHHLAYLASYQAASVVFTGQGKVGSENGAPQVPYQLSQRADFLECMTGVQTTFNRPMVNARDENLCGSDSTLARLHCIFYDSNLCQAANLLKSGMLQIFLALLEEDQVDLGLILDDPLEAVAAFSRDPTLHATARTAGNRRMTAVEWLLHFVARAERFHGRGGFQGVVPRAGEILALAADTLRKLEQGALEPLSARLDWALKLLVLRRTLARRPELSWDSPEIKLLDHLYSALDPAEGIYWAMERAGAVEQVVDPADVRLRVLEPPADTRAYTRAMLLRKGGADVTHVDWDGLSCKVPSQFGWPVQYKVALPDPAGMTRHETAHIFSNDSTLEETLAELEAVSHAAAAGPSHTGIAGNGEGDDHGIPRET